MGPANCLGSILSGLCLQLKILRAYSQMILGVAVLAVGLFILFAPRCFIGLHAAVPYTAFLAVVLIGFAESFVSMAAIQAMYNMQEKVHGKLSPTSLIRITAMWAAGYTTFMYASSFVAGALMEVLPFEDVAMMLIVPCAVSGAISVSCPWILDKRVHKSSDSSDTDSENEPLLFKEP